jgi:hypothetical protein
MRSRIQRQGEGDRCGSITRGKLIHRGPIGVRVPWICGMAIRVLGWPFASGINLSAEFEWPVRWKPWNILPAKLSSIPAWEMATKMQADDRTKSIGLSLYHVFYKAQIQKDKAMNPSLCLSHFGSSNRCIQYKELLGCQSRATAQDLVPGLSDVLRWNRVLS